MITEEKVNKLHQRAIRRMETAKIAIDEYKQGVDEILQEARAEAMSQKLTVTQMATLLGKSRPTVYRMGAADCQTYADLWRWTKANRPELLKTLEGNYNQWKRKWTEKRS